MKRRGRGEGSIRLRADGRWEATLSIPTQGGRRQRRSFFAKTRAEAAKKLATALKATNDGLTLPSERLTVALFLKQWLETKEPSLRPESFRRYRDVCELHLVPTLGHVTLGRLGPIQIQTAYASLREKGLSGTTMQLIHGVLHKALDDGARWSLLVRNVADLVDTPRRSTPEMVALRAEDAIRLMNCVKGDPLEGFYITALTTGLRLGELQALRWHELDLERRRLQVVATYQGNKDGEPQFSEPKTAKSRRTVHLSEVATDALRVHRGLQRERRLRVGPAWRDYDLVFANALGGPLDGNNLRKRSFARLLERAGLPPMRFHSLRHAAATVLMAEGVPIKAISEMLGHSDITTTLRVYAHVLPTAHEQAANAWDRMLRAPASGT